MCNFDVMRRGSYFEGEPIRTELEVGEKTQIARHQSMMILSGEEGLEYLGCNLDKSGTDEAVL